MAKGQQLYAYHPGKDSDWKLIKTFTDKHIYKITRIATNSTATMLALVAEASPEITVQQQLDAYNKRDVNAFMDTFSDNIKIYNFPDKLLYEGKEKIRTHYGSFFSATPDLHAALKHRTVIGNKVIDEEYLTMNGRHKSVVAIYEVANGKITKVTFIQ